MKIALIICISIVISVLIIVAGMVIPEIQKQHNEIKEKEYNYFKSVETETLNLEKEKERTKQEVERTKQEVERVKQKEIDARRWSK